MTATGIDSLLLASRVASIEHPAQKSPPSCAHRAAYDALVYAGRIMLAIACAQIGNSVLPLVDELLRLHGPGQGDERDALLLRIMRLFIDAGADETTMHVLRWAVTIMRTPRYAAALLRAHPLTQSAK